MIKRPLYLNQLTEYIDRPLIKVLVGLRRSGKSTLLDSVRDFLLEHGIPESHIIHINFESLDYVNIRDKSSFVSLIKSVLSNRDIKYYLLLDEPQNIDGWDEVVNAILADGLADIYITGSNSKLLSSELSTHLTGRFINIHVYPLNFKEYLDFRHSSGDTPGSLSEEFQRFMEMGGFPMLHASPFSYDECDRIVMDIYNSTIFRDLIERKNIRNTELLGRIVKYILDNIGNIFSASTIVDFMKSEYRSVDIETIYNYLDALEEVFVINRIPRYDIRGRALLKTNEKFFIGDIGFLYAVNGRNSSYISGVLENIVLNEFLSRGYQVYIGKNDTKEIDFIATRRQEKLYIQVATSIRNSQALEREFGAFSGIDDNYPKYILTLDENWTESKNGITQVYLPKFLTEFFK